MTIMMMMMKMIIMMIVETDNTNSSLYDSPELISLSNKGFIRISAVFS